ERGEPRMGVRLAGKAPGQDADDLAAPGEDRIREHAHQADGPAPVDQADPPADQGSGHGARGVAVLGPATVRGRAEDAEPLHPRWPSDSRAKRCHSPGTPLWDWGPRSCETSPEHDT